MRKFLAVGLLVLSSLLLPANSSSQDEEETAHSEPLWTEVLGSVNCLNASKERHIIRSDCDVTVCEFPQVSQTYVFVSCSSSENVTCVAAGKDGEDQCTDPEIAE